MGGSWKFIYMYTHICKSPNLTKKLQKRRKNTHTQFIDPYLGLQLGVGRHGADGGLSLLHQGRRYLLRLCDMC